MARLSSSEIESLRQEAKRNAAWAQTELDKAKPETSCLIPKANPIYGLKVSKNTADWE